MRKLMRPRPMLAKRWSASAFAGPTLVGRTGVSGGVGGDVDDWGRADVGQQLSMAGPGGGEPPAAVKKKRAADNVALDALVNPPGHVLRSAVPLADFERLKELTKSLDGVPAEDCTAFFKGGPPVKTRVTAGRRVLCSFSGSTAVCKAQPW